MDSKKEQKEEREATKFLDNLVGFLSAFEDQSLEELKVELREDGIDPDTLLTKARGLIASKIKDAKKHAWKEGAIQEKLEWEKRLADRKFEVPKSIASIKQIIRDMMGGGYGVNDQSRAVAHFRNLEEVDDEDLRTLYEDFMQLKSLNDNSEKND